MTFDVRRTASPADIQAKSEYFESQNTGSALSWSINPLYTSPVPWARSDGAVIRRKTLNGYAWTSFENRGIRFINFAWKNSLLLSASAGFDGLSAVFVSNDDRCRAYAYELPGCEHLADVKRAWIHAAVAVFFDDFLGRLACENCSRMAADQRRCVLGPRRSEAGLVG